MKKTVKKKQKRVVKRSPYKARGISKIVVLAIVAVVLAGAGGAYLFMQKNGSGGGASSALPFVKAPLNPVCKYNDPELCKFMNNFPTQTAYAVTSTGNMGGYSSESVYEISGEDKFHMMSKLNGKEQSNMISIGDDTYTLDYTDNKWWKQTLKPDDTVKVTENEVKDQFKFDETEVEDKTTYKFIAKEACGDLNCFKYEMISPDAAGAHSFMWFDDKDYLMRKMRVEDKEGSMDSIYSYNNISINVPSPVKEGTPNSSGGANPAMSDPEVQKMMQQYKEQSQSNDMPSDDVETPVDYSANEEY